MKISSGLKLHSMLRTEATDKLTLLCLYLKF